MTWIVVNADARHIPLADNSVHCVVTSPPYWGLRDYGLNDAGIGLEPTPELYVEHMVSVFREVRRVLRKDGSCWINLGDSYNASPGQRTEHDKAGWKQISNRGSCETASRSTVTLKPKDLVGIPWRVAFALQADGWWLRSDVIWSKPNPMPESVTDRPTKSHEYIFLLTKSANYFFDGEAVREPHQDQRGIERFKTSGGSHLSFVPGLNQGFNGVGWKMKAGAREYNEHGRNIRTVWEMATQAFPEAHFATFPEELAERCIKAGTSEKGCCSACGKPWERMTEKVSTGRFQKMADGWATHEGGHGSFHKNGREVGANGQEVMDSKTLGFQPACSCNAPSRPCTVLDPFAGAGTTVLVADKLGRHGVGLELKADYCHMARRRVFDDAPLLNWE